MLLPSGNLNAASSAPASAWALHDERMRLIRLLVYWLSQAMSAGYPADTRQPRSVLPEMLTSCSWNNKSVSALDG